MYNTHTMDKNKKNLNNLDSDFFQFRIISDQITSDELTSVIVEEVYVG